MPKRRQMSKEEVGQVELSDPQSDEDNEQFRDSASDEEGDNAIEHDESMYDGDNADEGQSADEQSDNLDKSRKKKIRKLKLDTTQDFNTTLSKRGILYLSRIPPRMGPSKIKSLLSDFGPITRIYLAEEDKVLRKKRRKAGGSGFKRYTEGWVEFESKKVAKLVGETLNMSRVAGNKRSLHYDDLWNVKYLRGFKWSHLTEKVAYERRIREQKLRVEMMEVRRENAAFVKEMESGKKLDYIEDRRRKRGMDDDKDSRDADGKGNVMSKKRRIRQKKIFEGEKSSTKSAILGSLV